MNDEQRKALEKAEASRDRFQRTVGNGQEQLRTPNDPLSTSIPEPGMIVGLGAIALLFLTQRKSLRSSRD